MNCQIIGFHCNPSDLCTNCKGTGDEPLTDDGSDPCSHCDRCFDEVIGWSTGIEPGSGSSTRAREFVNKEPR